eukprot:60794_1
MIKRKQRKGKGKVKTGRKLCISLFSVLLLATLTTLVLLGVKQRCPELGLCNCLYATMLTFGARKLESAILRGDAQLAREMIDDSAQMMAPFTLSLPGEEPKVSTFDVPIGGIGRNRSDKLRGVVYHPNSTARDVGDLRCIVIFLHGGGWVVGSVFESSQRAKDLAKASDLIVVSLQYRLSPEYVFPSQLNDVQRGLRYVRRHAAEWGGDPECIAMAGESAGGNLALTVGILSSPPQWRRRAPLCAIALSSPPLSYSHCSNREGTFKTFMKNHMLESSLVDVFWNAYLGPGKNGGNWRASPLHAPKSRLQKLCRTPVLFTVAEQEVLRDEIYEMHEKFLDMGIESTLTQYNGTIHGFFARGPPFDPGFQSVLQTGDFLKTHCRAKGQMNVMDVCPGNL